MKTVIYITRHGESVSNKSGTFTGSTDVPLSELGEKQAQKICDFLLDKNVDVIYSSPLSRAVATVTPLSEKLGMKVNTDERFSEIYFGRWEGKEKTYLTKHEPEFTKWCSLPLLAYPDDGENPKSVYKRFLSGMDELVKKHVGKNIVISSHGAIILSVMCGIGYKDADIAGAKDIARNASVTKLVYENGKYDVEFYAYEEYLAELKAEFRYV